MLFLWSLPDRCGARGRIPGRWKRQRILGEGQSRRGGVEDEKEGMIRHWAARLWMS